MFNKPYSKLYSGKYGHDIFKCVYQHHENILLCPVMDYSCLYWISMHISQVEITSVTTIFCGLPLCCMLLQCKSNGQGLSNSRITTLYLIPQSLYTYSHIRNVMGVQDNVICWQILESMHLYLYTRCLLESNTCCQRLYPSVWSTDTCLTAVTHGMAGK